MNDQPGMTFVLRELNKSHASIAALLNRNAELEAECAAHREAAAAGKVPADPLKRVDAPE